jgi:hypothetical protein
VSGGEKSTEWKIQLIAVVLGGAIAIAGSFAAYEIQLYDARQTAVRNYFGDLETVNASLSLLIEHDKNYPMADTNICNPDGTTITYPGEVTFPDHWPSEIYPGWGFYYTGSSEIGRFGVDVSDHLYAFYREILLTESIRQQFDNFPVYFPSEANNLTRSNARRAGLYQQLVCRARKVNSEIPNLKAELRKEAEHW